MDSKEGMNYWTDSFFGVVGKDHAWQVKTAPANVSLSCTARSRFIMVTDETLFVR